MGAMDEQIGNSLATLSLLTTTISKLSEFEPQSRYFGHRSRCPEIEVRHYFSGSLTQLFQVVIGLIKTSYLTLSLLVIHYLLGFNASVDGKITPNNPIDRGINNIFRRYLRTPSQRWVKTLQAVSRDFAP